MLKIVKNDEDTSQKTVAWYNNGLRFECTGCGKCCTGAPGYVYLSETEIETIAAHLQLSVKNFAMSYLRKVNGRWSLTEKRTTYDCVFLKDKKCQIYSVRPTQCRTYPWWGENLNSEESWKLAAAYCEGINESAPLVDPSLIGQQLEIQTNSRL